MTILRSPLQSAFEPSVLAPTAPRAGGGSAPPSGWTPIQQMPGWDFSGISPLNEGVTDTGSKWIGVNQAILGLDATAFILEGGIGLPGPINLPARVVITYADTVADPGTLVLPATISLSTFEGTLLNQSNSAPPTTAFDGAPFSFDMIVNAQGALPATSGFSVRYSPPNITNLGGGPGTYSLVCMLELELEEGIWTIVQDIPGVDIFMSSGTNSDGEFSITGAAGGAGDILSFEVAVVGEYPSIPVRLTILEYEEVPGDPAGALAFPGFFRINIGAEEGFVIENEAVAYPSVFPTTAFTDSPYTGATNTNITPSNPGTCTLAISINGPAYDNADVAGVVMNYELAIEVELP